MAGDGDFILSGKFNIEEGNLNEAISLVEAAGERLRQGQAEVSEGGAGLENNLGLAAYKEALEELMRQASHAGSSADVSGIVARLNENIEAVTRAIEQSLVDGFARMVEDIRSTGVAAGESLRGAGERRGGGGGRGRRGEESDEDRKGERREEDRGPGVNIVERRGTERRSAVERQPVEERARPVPPVARERPVEAPRPTPRLEDIAVSERPSTGAGSAKGGRTYIWTDPVSGAKTRVSADAYEQANQEYAQRLTAPPPAGRVVPPAAVVPAVVQEPPVSEEQRERRHIETVRPQTTDTVTELQEHAARHLEQAASDTATPAYREAHQQIAAGLTTAATAHGRLDDLDKDRGYRYADPAVEAAYQRQHSPVPPVAPVAESVTPAQRRPYLDPAVEAAYQRQLTTPPNPAHYSLDAQTGTVQYRSGPYADETREPTIQELKGKGFSRADWTHNVETVAPALKRGLGAGLGDFLEGIDQIQGKLDVANGGPRTRTPADDAVYAQQAERDKESDRLRVLRETAQAHATQLREAAGVEPPVAVAAAAPPVVPPRPPVATGLPEEVGPDEPVPGGRPLVLADRLDADKPLSTAPPPEPPHAQQFRAGTETYTPEGSKKKETQPWYEYKDPEDIGEHGEAPQWTRVSPERFENLQKEYGGRQARRNAPDPNELSEGASNTISNLKTSADGIRELGASMEYLDAKVKLLTASNIEAANTFLKQTGDDENIQSAADKQRAGDVYKDTVRQKALGDITAPENDLAGAVQAGSAARKGDIGVAAGLATTDANVTSRAQGELATELTKNRIAAEKLGLTGTAGLDPAHLGVAVTQAKAFNVASLKATGVPDAARGLSVTDVDAGLKSLQDAALAAADALKQDAAARRDASTAARQASAAVARATPTSPAQEIDKSNQKADQAVAVTAQSTRDDLLRQGAGVRAQDLLRLQRQGAIYGLSDFDTASHHDLQTGVAAAATLYRNDRNSTQGLSTTGAVQALRAQTEATKAATEVERLNKQKADQAQRQTNTGAQGGALSQFAHAIFGGALAGGGGFRSATKVPDEIRGAPPVSALAQGFAGGAGYNALFALQAGVFSAISAASQLDKQFQILKTDVSAVGGTGDQFNAMRENILNTADATGVAGTELAALSQGFVGLYGNVNQANGALGGAAKILAVTGESAAQAGPELGAIIQNLGLSTQQIGNADVTVSQRTGKSAADVQGGVAALAPVAAAYGFTANQTYGLIDAATKGSAVSATDTGASLDRILTALPGQVTALSQYGIKFSNPANNLSDLKDLLAQLKNNPHRNDIINSLGGPRNAAALSALTNNPAGLLALNGNYTNNDALNTQNDAIQKSLAQSFDRLRESASKLADALIEGALGKTLEDIASAGAKVAGAFAEFFQLLSRINNDLGGAPTQVLTAAAGIAALRRVGGGVGAAYQGGPPDAYIDRHGVQLGDPTARGRFRTLTPQEDLPPELRSTSEQTAVADAKTNQGIAAARKAEADATVKSTQAQTINTDATNVSRDATAADNVVLTDQNALLTDQNALYQINTDAKTLNAQASVVDDAAGGAGAAGGARGALRPKTAAELEADQADRDAFGYTDEEINAQRRGEAIPAVPSRYGDPSRGGAIPARAPVGPVVSGAAVDSHGYTAADYAKAGTTDPAVVAARDQAIRASYAGPDVAATAAADVAPTVVADVAPSVVGDVVPVVGAGLLSRYGTRLSAGAASVRSGLGVAKTDIAAGFGGLASRFTAREGSAAAEAGGVEGLTAEGGILAKGGVFGAGSLGATLAGGAAAYGGYKLTQAGTSSGQYGYAAGAEIVGGGIATGAGIGFAIGGPAGAVVGGAAGLVYGGVRDYLHQTSQPPVTVEHGETKDQKSDSLKWYQNNVNNQSDMLTQLENIASPTDAARLIKDVNTIENASGSTDVSATFTDLQELTTKLINQPGQKGVRISGKSALYIANTNKKADAAFATAAKQAGSATPYTSVSDVTAAFNAGQLTYQQEQTAIYGPEGVLTSEAAGAATGTLSEQQQYRSNSAAAATQQSAEAQAYSASVVDQAVNVEGANPIQAAAIAQQQLTANLGSAGHAVRVYVPPNPAVGPTGLRGPLDAGTPSGAGPVGPGGLSGPPQTAAQLANATGLYWDNYNYAEPAGFNPLPPTALAAEGPAPGGSATAAPGDTGQGSAPGSTAPLPPGTYKTVIEGARKSVLDDPGTVQAGLDLVTALHAATDYRIASATNRSSGPDGSGTLSAGNLQDWLDSGNTSQKISAADANAVDAADLRQHKAKQFADPNNAVVAITPQEIAAASQKTIALQQDVVNQQLASAQLAGASADELANIQYTGDVNMLALLKKQAQAHPNDPTIKQEEQDEQTKINQDAYTKQQAKFDYQVFQGSYTKSQEFNNPVAQGQTDIDTATKEAAAEGTNPLAIAAREASGATLNARDQQILQLYQQGKQELFQSAATELQADLSILQARDQFNPLALAADEASTTAQQIQKQYGSQSALDAAAASGDVNAKGLEAQELTNKNNKILAIQQAASSQLQLTQSTELFNPGKSAKSGVASQLDAINKAYGSLNAAKAAAAAGNTNAAGAVAAYNQAVYTAFQAALADKLGPLQVLAAQQSAKGNVVGAANTALKEAEAAVSAFKAASPQDAKLSNATYAALVAAVATAKGNVLTTTVSFAETQIQELIDTNGISIGQGIQRLQALYAQAIKAGDTSEALSIKDQIQQYINQGNQNAQFDLPNINLPTLYEARRSEGTRGGTNYYGNSGPVNVNININGNTDTTAAVNQIARAVGGSPTTGNNLPPY